MLLGYMLCDIPAAEVYQLHREPPDWRWQPDPAGFDYQSSEPSSTDGPPALVFSLSATITDERVHAVLPAGGRPCTKHEKNDSDGCGR
ncbi:MAG: SAVED domain-containing protein [Bryobacteraceae bacterium]